MPFALVATVSCAKRGGPLNTGDALVVGGAMEGVDVGVERLPRRPTTGAAGDIKREDEKERGGGDGLSNISCMTSFASICWARARALQNKMTTQPMQSMWDLWCMGVQLQSVLPDALGALRFLDR